MAAAVDRRQALSESNLLFAFHHYDIENKGYITKEGLESAFAREGKHFSADKMDLMMTEINKAKDGKINYEEFCKIIKAELAEPGSPTKVPRGDMDVELKE